MDIILKIQKSFKIEHGKIYSLNNPKNYSELIKMIKKEKYVYKNRKVLLKAFRKIKK